MIIENIISKKKTPQPTKKDKPNLEKELIALNKALPLYTAANKDRLPVERFQGALTWR